MAKIRFKNNKVEDYTIVLSTRDKRHLGQLHGLKSVRHAANMNSANEMSFSIYKDGLLDFNTEGKTEDKIKQIKESREQLWKTITNHKLIWVKELEEYFEITVNLDDSNDIVKNITATSLCEAELSQTNLYSIEINTDADIELRGGSTVFYDPNNPKLSLLHRILDKTPHYTIKHVDDSLRNIQRTFSVDGTSIYDFMIGDCSTEIGCLFQFDSITRGIRVYDLFATCLDCNERGDFDNECPECKSTNLERYGSDTTIFIDKNNLTDAIHYEESPDTMKNCFKLEAGDDTITTAVMQLNPNGSDYIMSFTQEQMDEMPIELKNGMISYNSLYQNRTEEYEDLTRQYYDLLGEKNELEFTMMPTVEQAEVNASTEVAKLTAANLSPTAMSKIDDKTNVSSVNLAILTYAKVFVRTGYVKLEINDGATFTYGGTYTKEEDGSTYDKGTWTGSFKVTNYSDEEDVCETGNITIEINTDFITFNEQKFKKSLVVSDEDTVFDVLSIKDLNKFKEALTYYSLSRLESFYNALDSALLVLKQSGQGEDGAELYEPLYVPYNEKFKACEAEHQIRSDQVAKKQTKIDNVLSHQQEINKELDFEKYLGKELYAIFCSYRREDKYSNSNYVSDGLDDAEIIDKAKEFLKVAKMELEKATKKQITITATLYNLLLIPEFKPLVEHFELGNWLRMKVDGKHYTLRLIGYEIDFDNIQNINVTFSNASEENDFMSDVESILSSAQNLTTSFDSVSRQAEQGSDAQSNIQQWINEGLDSALVNINNSHATFTLTEKGLLGRTYDDVLGIYGDEQLIITDNVIGFTSNNFKSLECALGKHNFRQYDSSWDTKTSKTSFRPSVGYGLTSRFVQSAYISGSEIIGGKIFSENYSSAKKVGTLIDLNNSKLYLGKTSTAENSSWSLSWDGSELNVQGNIKGGSIDLGNGTFLVDNNGNMTATSATITGTIDVQSGSKIAGFTIDDKYIQTTNKKVGIGSDANWAFWAGYNESDGTAKFKVTQEGAVTASNMNITGGSITIGNFVVNNNGITLPPSTTITWSQITDADSKVTTITEDTLETTNVIAQNLQVKAANIDGKLTADKINADGIAANNVDITGKIDAESGSIAGFNIGSGGFYDNALYKRAGDYESGFKATARDKDLVFYVKKIADGSNVFWVNNNGKLYCSDIEVTGGSIKLGGMTLNSDGTTLTAGDTKVGSKSLKTYVEDLAVGTLTADRINTAFESADQIHVKKLYVDNLEGLYVYHWNDSEGEYKFTNVGTYLNFLNNRISNLAAAAAIDV